MVPEKELEELPLVSLHQVQIDDVLVGISAVTPTKDKRRGTHQYFEVYRRASGGRFKIRRYVRRN